MASEHVEAKLRMAVIGPGDILDARLWSGTPARVVHELKQVFDVVYVERRPFARAFEFTQKVIRRLTGGRVDIMWSSLATRLATASARARIAAAQPDVVFVISSSPLCRQIARDHKAVTIADATGQAIVRYYPTYGPLLKPFRDAIIRFSGEAVTRSMLCLYPSDWARQSAIHDYGVPPGRALEIAWGPNIPEKPQARARTLSVPLRLLFVGFDWVRKGGPVTVEAVKLLRARGLDVRLDVVGPALDGAEADAVTFHGALDKRVAAQAALLDSLFEAAHLFVLPTLFECYGIVFAEAAAYGLPVLSCATGGVPSVVRDGETGLLIPPGSAAVVLADAIKALAGDPERYEAMSRAAIRDSEERLDWAVWGRMCQQAVVAAMAAPDR